MNIKLRIKPLSVNKAWQGRRYKTDDYKAYEKEVLYSLPNNIPIPESKMRIDIKFVFSSRGSDIDNPVKMFLDILQKKYGFNDSVIYDLRIKKDIVKKGSDFIQFSIRPYEVAEAH